MFCSLRSTACGGKERKNRRGEGGKQPQGWWHMEAQCAICHGPASLHCCCCIENTTVSPEPNRYAWSGMRRPVLYPQLFIALVHYVQRGYTTTTIFSPPNWLWNDDSDCFNVCCLLHGRRGLPRRPAINSWVKTTTTQIAWHLSHYARGGGDQSMSPRPPDLSSSPKSRPRGSDSCCCTSRQRPACQRAST